MSNNWYKNKKTDKIWWLDTPDRVGEWVFSFDKKTQFNLFRDFPWKLSEKERTIFIKENPQWAEFFADRLKGE